ncbi:MAG: tRNA pseudouridine(55) synthase TruB [Clostridia bacterium]|nr:tRNA pseudouridine(55) synthase TruB [Clostridia bacterium]
MKSGILNVYKEKGFTSHDVVAKVRFLLGTRKVGHAGTLDPDATGVLPVLVGNAAKACDLIPEDTKTYRASLRFGISTDTEDVWGKILREDDARPKRSELEEAMKEFLGAYQQIPPMVSAVKVDGKKLYEYARAGITVERKPRPVTVHSFELLSFSENEAEFRAKVSRGTYIRTLLVDLCAKLGVLGAMSALEREESAGLGLDTAVTLSCLEKMEGEERKKWLLPTEWLFRAHPVFELPPFFDRLVANGCAVNVEKLGLDSAAAGSRYRLYQNGVFFAVGEIREEEGAKKLFKIKNFPPDGEA